mgnify:FL=1
MTLSILCSQNQVHIPKPIKRFETKIRNKVMRIAKVCDQIAREDVAYVKTKIPKIDFNNDDHDNEEMEQVNPIIVNGDADIFDSD